MLIRTLQVTHSLLIKTIPIRTLSVVSRGHYPVHQDTLCGIQRSLPCPSGHPLWYPEVITLSIRTLSVVSRGHYPVHQDTLCGIQMSLPCPSGHPLWYPGHYWLISTPLQVIIRTLYLYPVGRGYHIPPPPPPRAWTTVIHL